MTEPTPARRSHRGVLRALLVPLLLALVVSAAAGGPGPGWIKIKRGDTLSELALKHHTTVAALRALNKLPGNNLIIEGRWLRVGKVPVVTKATPTAKFKTVAVTYVVRSGDGVYRIANKFSADPNWIAKRNNLRRGWMIHPGQRLVVGMVKVRTAAKPKKVSRAYVRQLIVRESKRAGLDPALALALAYEESGWQQSVTSSVGAIGAMQVMPRTGAWVAKYLVGRPLDLRKAEDNVLAGVRYLAMLKRLAPRTELAVAGYYQGLTSVMKKGMYDDTKAYVANILALRHRFVS
jgi:soluble lytic murein transglycosylase-like protein